MWSRVGIKTEVDAVAPPVFFKNRDTFKYSAYMAGWGAVTGETSNAMQSLVATADKAKGMGTTNSARYSNPVLDAKLAEAMRTVDDDKREGHPARGHQDRHPAGPRHPADPLRGLGVGDPQGPHLCRPRRSERRWPSM